MWKLNSWYVDRVCHTCPFSNYKAQTPKDCVLLFMLASVLVDSVEDATSDQETLDDEEPKLIQADPIVMVSWCCFALDTCVTDKVPYMIFKLHHST